ncbi:myocyte-specific enhancer factor 2B isoform X1 [Oncorhynchus mykiss]|uniref:myocyte-specific enhancer factor 2B isoform X1 n=1 Tax=Oncorhynchus mykiss TaxID=8022 RepID=UPI001877F8D6|nr:myocyte-specific enhancer factor 2B isoform X1 [Oncorhynchus mykiss]
MGRKKIQISRILDQRNRQVTFTKRKFGLMKKAYELSVLCDCEIALIIFNSTNRLFQYASTDMDKVLLKYTEYSEPHESRTNTDILETLRRKGLGLDGTELLDTEEPMQVAAEKYGPHSEGMDLSLARQRYYVSTHTGLIRQAPSLHSPEAQFLVSTGCENGYPNSSNPSPSSHRPPAFKPLGPRPGSASPAGPHCHAAFMSPHSGIGNSMFSHGNLSRALEMKTPPPLNLGSENRRTESHPGMGGTRANFSSSRGLLYPGMHPGNHMLAMGKTGLLTHGLGGYSLSSAGPSDYSHPGFSHAVSLQRGTVNPWQTAQPQEQHVPHLSPAMSSGGCSFPSQSSTPTPPPHPSLNLSIKSERCSPEHICSPTSPPVRHLRQHSPMSTSNSAHHTPQEPYPANEREDFPKGGVPYPAQHGAEEKGGLPLRQLEISDGWQR